ncbi:MAG: hypothetical protein CMQ40_09725 [Gammaproteobacteria bacterium]|nr:hypothetical protein [Gammaproteobacteria bacterium]
MGKRVLSKEIVGIKKGGLMKVFIPMADENIPMNDGISRTLVPFDPSFFKAEATSRSGQKPHNWVSESTREQALVRLLASQA